MTLGFWIVLSLITKIVLYIGTIGAAGTALFRVIFSDVAHLASKRLFGWLVFTAICATFLGYALRSATLTGDSSGLTDMEMHLLLWDTAVGTSFTTRMIGLFILLLSLLMKRSGAIIAMLIGAAIVLWSFTQIGHATELGTWFTSILFFIHFATAAFWVGALVPLLRAANGNTTLQQAADIADRFGRKAAVLVPILIAAGLVLAWNLLPDIASIWTTAYGRLLLLKIVFVAGLLGLAAANKLRFVPAMERGDPAGALHLAKSIKWEICAVLVILTITAFLTSTVTFPE
ncbi:MAG TPA: copper-binding protein, partial [Rhodobacteraceae bacterium]|nr:copper-binding protein [Paracoccaceae bacterium]